MPFLAYPFPFEVLCDNGFFVRTHGDPRCLRSKSGVDLLSIAERTRRKPKTNAAALVQNNRDSISRSLVPVIPCRGRPLSYATRVVETQTSYRSSLPMRQDRCRDHVTRHRRHKRCPTRSSRDRRAQDRVHLDRRGVDLFVVLGVHRPDRGVDDCRHPLKNVDRGRPKARAKEVRQCMGARER